MADGTRAIWPLQRPNEPRRASTTERTREYDNDTVSSVDNGVAASSVRSLPDRLLDPMDHNAVAPTAGRQRHHSSSNHQVITMSSDAPAPRNPFADIAPALADYTDNVLFGDVWKRTQLSPHDRSPVTVACLVALYRVNVP